MKNYINNADFYDAIVKYQASVKRAAEIGENPPQMSNYLGECFLKIAKGIATKNNFRDYSYIKDMTSAGVETCIRRIMSFDPERSKNPFAYFTQSVWNSFLLVLGKEKKQTRIKRAAFFSSVDMDAFTTQAQDEGEDFQIAMNDFLRSLGENDIPKKIEKKEKISPLDEFIK